MCNNDRTNQMTVQIKLKNEDIRKYKESVRDIKQIASTLGDIQKYFIFIHAFGWSDSAIFGQGKVPILRLLSSENKKRSLTAREAADVFSVQM